MEYVQYQQSAAGSWPNPIELSPFERSTPLWSGNENQQYYHCEGLFNGQVRASMSVAIAAAAATAAASRTYQYWERDSHAGDRTKMSFMQSRGSERLSIFSKNSMITPWPFHDGGDESSSRRPKVVPGLPRLGTFKRQKSELRDSLEPSPSRQRSFYIPVDLRPTVPPTSGDLDQKTSTCTGKDADIRYPCPHCSKIYLHWENLTRHILRHILRRMFL